MNADAFRHFYAYHFAENRKIWAYAEQLSDAQFTQAVAYSHGSVRDQIIHLIQCDEGWFSELSGAEPPDPSLPAGERTSIRIYWDNVEQQMRTYLADLQNEMLLTKPIQEPAEDQGFMVWQVLLHVVNHATDHRAQLLRLFNDLGIQTSWQDYIFYAYSNPIDEVQSHP